MPIGLLSNPRFLLGADLRPLTQKIFPMPSQCWQNRSACLQLGEVVTCGGAGAANIQDGVTIDLSELTQVEVSKDRTSTSVGGGARWEDVYHRLDAMNLAVLGGRVHDVGVGGLTLGGKSSAFGSSTCWLTYRSRW